MDDANALLRSLHAERQGRRPAPTQAATQPLPSKQESPGAPLSKAHRSIRLAHTLGFILSTTALAFLLLFGVGRVLLGMLALGVLCARSGGPWLHGVMPACLQEGAAPGADEAARTEKGIFSVQGLQNFSTALGDEYGLFLDSLAFVVTYGKKNCLTNDVYSSPLSLPRIMSLVQSKLAAGLVQCR